MPTLKIDGIEITVEPGTRIIEACDRLGIDIPRFCYHPGLSVAANCRMCLVESNRSPKPVPSCYEMAVDGLEIQTKTQKVIDARRAVLEYILLNHPIDCPICDKAGECDLQDLYFAHNYQPSRHAFPKFHKPKARQIGPQIMADSERCINCTRCIRVCDEIAKAPQLHQVNRGGRTYIDVFPGTEIDHPYSMCVSDVCPVGALTTKDFRFKCRVWFTNGTQSVCGECSRGCSIRIDTYRNEIQRIMPRENPTVNQFWACDAGRLAYHNYETDRLQSAKANGQPVASDAAITQLATALDNVASGARVLVVLSPSMTNEAAWAAIKVGQKLKGMVRYAIGGREAGFKDDILICADKAPNRAGLALVLKTLGVEAVPLSAALAGSPQAIYIFGDDHHLEDVLVKAMSAAQLSVVFSAKDGPLANAASFAFPTMSPYEIDGTWLNEFGILQRVRPALTPTWDARPIEKWLGALTTRLLDEQIADDPAELFVTAMSSVNALDGTALAASGLDGIGPFGIALK